jgi:hypothetical protein
MFNLITEQVTKAIIPKTYIRNLSGHNLGRLTG